MRRRSSGSSSSAEAPERVSVEAWDSGLWVVGQRYFPSSTASSTSSECLKGADVTPVSVPNG